MLLSAIRSMKACLLAAGLAVASSALLASTALAADRLALVIGEASYVGDPLPTVAADAALVAKTLGAQGFDVTELHELNTADLAAGYQAFLAKARSAPTASITVYLAGLGANVGCDDYPAADRRADRRRDRCAEGRAQPDPGDGRSGADPIASSPRPARRRPADPAERHRRHAAPGPDPARAGAGDQLRPGGRKSTTTKRRPRRATPTTPSRSG